MPSGSTITIFEIINISELALKSPIKPNKELLSASDDGGGILASMVSHHAETYNNNTDNAGS